MLVRLHSGWLLSSRALHEVPDGADEPCKIVSLYAMATIAKPLIRAHPGGQGGGDVAGVVGSGAQAVKLSRVVVDCLCTEASPVVFLWVVLGCVLLALLLAACRWKWLSRWSIVMGTRKPTGLCTGSSVWFGSRSGEDSGRHAPNRCNGWLAVRRGTVAAANV